MELVNLTPHLVTVYNSEGKAVLTVLPEETPARVEELSICVDTIYTSGLKLPILKKAYGAVQNLPEPREGVRYIVSAIVLDACKHRKDLVTPTNVVRDAGGAILGCKAFQSNV